MLTEGTKTAALSQKDIRDIAVKTGLHISPLLELVTLTPKEATCPFIVLMFFVSWVS